MSDQSRPRARQSGAIVWLDGKFLSVEEAAVSPLDRGFLFGDGVFETMRCEGGWVFYLEDHLQRLFGSLRELRIAPPVHLDWRYLIAGLVASNDLKNAVASVKIVVTRGIAPGYGLPPAATPTVCVTAQPYHPPSVDVYQRGWRLTVFESGFSPPLAKYKSLNYLYFLMARQDALDAHADEAVIIDPEGCVAETSAGSILACTAGRWWTPASPYQLSGITLRQVVRFLADQGQMVERRTATRQHLLAAETVWVLNSLLGAMPVYAISGSAVSNPAADEAAQMRRRLFSRPGQ